MKRILLVLSYLVCLHVSGQTKIKDGTIASPQTPNLDAILELESNKKGFLLPRIQLSSLSNAAPLAAHVEGMTVYNTATAGTAPDDVTPGFYYNDGLKWIKLNTTSKEPWNVSGTSDPAEENTQNIYQMGNVGIQTSMPSSSLHVNGSISLPHRTSTDAHVTLNNADHTIIVYGTGGYQMNLPEPSSCPGRIYTIVNASAGNYFYRVSGSGYLVYVPAQGGGINVVQSGQVDIIQSNGNSGTYNWVKINPRDREPWYDAATHSPASSNNQNLYQMGRVGLGYNNPQAQLHVIKKAGELTPAIIDGCNAYADNAAAVAAGVPVGGLYRTGDILKVVH